jgi:hypothetical protein
MLDDPIVRERVWTMAPTWRRLIYSGAWRWEVELEGARQAVLLAVNDLLVEGSLHGDDALGILRGIEHSDLSTDALRRFLSLLTKYFRQERRITLKGPRERWHLRVTESSASRDGDDPFYYGLFIEEAVSRLPPQMQEIVGYKMYKMPTARAIKRNFGLRRRQWDALVAATCARLKTELCLIEQERSTKTGHGPGRQTLATDDSTIESAILHSDRSGIGMGDSSGGEE